MSHEPIRDLRLTEGQDPEFRRKPSTRCEVLLELPSGGRLKCDQPTREGKPACPLHVEAMPYVRVLLAEVAVRVAAIAKAARSGRGDTGAVYDELVTWVRVHGPKTVERIARELNVPIAAVKAYVRVGKKRRVLRTRLTKRGSTVVMLADHKGGSVESEKRSKPPCPPC